MGSAYQTTGMNWIGATFLLFFAFQDIIFAKYLSIVTEDENRHKGEDDEDYRVAISASYFTGEGEWNGIQSGSAVGNKQISLKKSKIIESDEEAEILSSTAEKSGVEKNVNLQEWLESPWS